MRGVFRLAWASSSDLDGFSCRNVLRDIAVSLILHTEHIRIYLV